jgi:peptide/nickel transport system permease protein
MKAVLKKQKIASAIIFIYCVFALIAPIIANKNPLYISINNKSYFPAFSNDAYFIYPDKNGNENKLYTEGLEWDKLNYDKIIYPPVRWSGNSDLINSYVSPFDEQKKISGNKQVHLPFSERHFLGTAKKGNDILSSLIYGSRTSLLIGFTSIFIAVIIGFFAGTLSGYYGDYRFKIPRGNFFLIIIFFIPAIYYSFYLRKDFLYTGFNQSEINGLIQASISLLIFLAVIFTCSLPYFGKSIFLGDKISLPVDSIISRSIEIFLSVPRLILIVCLAGIFHSSLLSIILIIGLTSWTEIARIMRALTLQLRSTNFIESSDALGNSALTTIFRHLLPNLLPQLSVLCIYGIASAIMVEAGLSFLCILVT